MKTAVIRGHEDVEDVEDVLDFAASRP